MKKSTVVFFLAMVGISVAPLTASADEVFNSSLSSPGVYYGTGNSNAGFDVLTATNSDGSTLQLGLEAVNRFIGPITPTTNDYTYSPTTGNRASWDFVFSANTGADTLNAYTFTISITDDTTFKSTSFNPLLLPDNAQVNSSGVVCNGCGMQSGDDGFQNSENLGFSFLSTPLSFNPDVPDTYTITLSAIPTTGTAADPSVSIDLTPMAPTPEPGSIALLGTGFLGLFGLARRKRFVA